MLDQRPANSAPISFVCCVESGWLENQTIRMIESLRKWGGKFADAPMYAVTPRFGPPLSRKTHEVFERLAVKHVRFQPDNPYDWKGFMNKHYSMAAIEEECDTELLGWLDSDLLILGEPEGLLLADDEDIVACASDKNIGSTGPDDPFDTFWAEVCKVVGLELDDLPWVVTEREGERIRLYWNSGVFVYRRSTKFSKAHLENTLRVLDARLANKKAGAYFTQHTLGLTAVKEGLRWRSLPHAYNYGISSRSYPDWFSIEKLREAKILHYHDFMWPDYWNTLISLLKETHPEVADWLAPLGSMKNDAALPWRLMQKGLGSLRANKAKQYQASCRVV